MKKILLAVILMSVFSVSVFTETIFMKNNSDIFGIEINENLCGKEFLELISDNTIAMEKYGGFEFYVNKRLNEGNEPRTSSYKKGNIYYNITYKAISFVYEDHELGNPQAVLIGKFKDKKLCDYLKTSSNNMSFSFSKSK